jgi:hypothetical protein
MGRRLFFQKFTVYKEGTGWTSFDNYFANINEIRKYLNEKGYKISRMVENRGLEKIIFYIRKKK